MVKVFLKLLSIQRSTFWINFQLRVLMIQHSQRVHYYRDFRQTSDIHPGSFVSGTFFILPRCQQKVFRQLLGFRSSVKWSINNLLMVAFRTAVGFYLFVCFFVFTSLGIITKFVHIEVMKTVSLSWQQS